MPTSNSKRANSDRNDDYIDCSQFIAGERLKDLTTEELSEISRAFNEFQGYRYHPDVGDSLLSAIAAAALCNYALRLIMEALEDRNTVESADKAISITRKAIDLYPHPALFGRLARFLEVTGWQDDARQMRSIQDKQQATWVARQTSDEMLMIRLDSDMCLEMA